MCFELNLTKNCLLSFGLGVLVVALWLPQSARIWQRRIRTKDPRAFDASHPLPLTTSSVERNAHTASGPLLYSTPIRWAVFSWFCLYYGLKRHKGPRRVSPTTRPQTKPSQSKRYAHFALTMLTSSIYRTPCSAVAKTPTDAGTLPVHSLAGAPLFDAWPVAQLLDMLYPRSNARLCLCAPFSQMDHPLTIIPSPFAVGT